MKFWARVSNFACLVALASLAHPQAFGRFGYTSQPAAPGFAITQSGFRVDGLASDTFRFLQPLTGFRTTEVSDRHMVFSRSDYAGMPSRLRVNLQGSGFEAYFPLGIEIRLTSLTSPLLSWTGGSTDAGTPTAPSNWLMVSFQDRQAPVLFTFESPVQMIISGKAGDWRLRTTTRYVGWAKVSLPRGQNAMPGTGVAALGETCLKIGKSLAYWGALTPKLVNFEIRSDADSVTGVWTYSAAGAVVPPAAILAKAGGYPVKILTGIRPAEADQFDGPTYFTTEPKLAIQFPLKRIGSGRGLAIGKLTGDLIGTASPYDVPSIVELALSNMMGIRDQLLSDGAEGALGDYVVAAPYFVEPITKQRLPYDANGDGIDLAAAHALLMQSTLAAAGADSLPNSLFMSVQWRMDWRTWKIWCPDEKKGYRASGILAVAGALCPEPERRLAAAMLNAGIAYARALPLYRQKRGFPPADLPVVEPLRELREILFASTNSAVPTFGTSLLGEIRVLSHQGVQADISTEGWKLSFTPNGVEPATLTLASAFPLSVSSVENVESYEVKDLVGVYQFNIRPKQAGKVTIELKKPSWNPTLPTLVMPPTYSE